MHLAVCIDMHFETPSVLRLLLTNFAVAVLASNLACTPLSRYEYFYIGIMIVNFISIYQYIGISRTYNSSCYELSHSILNFVAYKNTNLVRLSFSQVLKEQNWQDLQVYEMIWLFYIWQQWHETLSIYVQTILYL